MCVCDCFTMGPWAAMKCSWKPHNWTWGIYTLLWMNISVTHCSDMRPASLCVCTLPHALSVCIRAPRPGLAVYLGMWNLEGGYVFVCVISGLKDRYRSSVDMLQIHFWALWCQKKNVTRIQCFFSPPEFRISFIKTCRPSCDTLCWNPYLLICGVSSYISAGVWTYVGG